MRIILRLFWFLGLTTLTLASLLALYSHRTTSLDPVAEIERLRLDNRRDEALDLAKFLEDNQLGDPEVIRSLRRELTPSAWTRIKSVIWDGAVKGEVYDTYSGIGAISADLCILGDLRDVGVQSWKYATGQGVDKSILLLSGIGLVLSARPVADGLASLAKNAVKYLARLPGSMKKGLLKTLLNRRLAKRDATRLWGLFRANEWSIPRTVGQLSRIKRIKDIDTAIGLIKRHGNTGRVYVHLTGDSGLKLYELSAKTGTGKWLIKAFKRKPRVFAGLTKSHLIVHSIKILDKHGLTALAIPGLAITLTLGLLPAWLLWLIFATSSTWLLFKVFRTYGALRTWWREKWKAKT